MRKYSMEYYMMNDVTLYCPEWETPEMMTGVKNLEESESMIGKLFRKLFD